MPLAYICFAYVSDVGAIYKSPVREAQQKIYRVGARSSETVPRMAQGYNRATVNVNFWLQA